MFEKVINKFKKDNFDYFGVKSEKYISISNTLNEVVVEASNMRKMGCKNIQFYKIKNVIGGASFVKTTLADIAKLDSELQHQSIQNNNFEDNFIEKFENPEEDKKTQKAESVKQDPLQLEITSDDLEKRLAEVQKRGGNGK